MDLFCSHCEHEIDDASPDMEDAPCPKCGEGTMLSVEDEFESDLDIEEDIDLELMVDDMLETFGE